MVVEAAELGVVGDLSGTGYAGDGRQEKVLGQGAKHGGTTEKFGLVGGEVGKFGWGILAD